MSGSPSESASPTPTPTVTPTATPTPTPTAFNPTLYSIDKASSLWVVVDKKRPLNPLNYKPKGLTAPAFKKSASNPYGIRLAKPAAEAIVAMANAMSKAKAGTLVLSSAYRSYNTQVVVHARDVEQLGLIAGERLAARPGYSEHQTGLAADVSAVGQGCVIRVCFSKTPAGKWLAANSWQYGFILRYPNGRTATTGYQFEPWHFRYVGVELATQMKFTNTAVLEDFFGLPAAPNY
ncbi:MAG: M15 family metallopeptidase [Micrococcales bacterium]